jgi:ATP-dependent DNA helicase RecG
MLLQAPDMTIPVLAKALEISTRAVEKQIVRLRKEGRLRRIGPDKGGHWEVIE